MKKKTLILIAVFTWNAPLFSQDKKAETFSFDIKQSIDYAFQHQSSVLNSALDEEIARAKVKEITGIGMPQINAGIDLKDFVQLPTSLIPAQFFGGKAGEFMPIKFGTKYNATPSIDASQLIFDGSYLVGLQAAKTYMELSGKSAQKSKIEVAATVTKAYYTVLVNEEHAKLLEINIEKMKKLLSDTKALNENGFVENIDLSRLSVAYNNLISENEKIKRLIDLSYYLLKFQMGMDVSSSLTLTDKLTEVDFKSIPLPAEKFDYSKKIEYSMLQTVKKLNELDLKKNKMQYFPSLVAYGSLSTQAQRDEFNFFDTKQKWFPIGVIGAKLSIPIFDGLQKYRRIQQSNLNIKKTQNDMQMVSQSIELELESAKVNLLNSITAMETQKKNMELADEIYKVTKTKYEQGVGSNLEIINAESSQKEARINYYSALYDALIAKVNLEKASGTLLK